MRWIGFFNGQLMRQVCWLSPSPDGGWVLEEILEDGSVVETVFKDEKSAMVAYERLVVVSMAETGAKIH